MTNNHNDFTMTSASFYLSTILLIVLIALSCANDVAVDIIKAAESGAAAVTRDHRYSSHVTLYIKNADGSKTPSGWSTRKSDGAPADQPFAFQPGVGLIEGWTEGVLKMKEGERSWLTVPSDKGYGAQSMGTPGESGFYIPANSNLLFDIEILGKESDLLKQDL